MSKIRSLDEANTVAVRTLAEIAANTRNTIGDRIAAASVIVTELSLLDVGAGEATYLFKWAEPNG